MSSQNEILKRLDEIQGAIKALTDDFGKHKENMEHFKADFEAHKENMEPFKADFEAHKDNMEKFKDDFEATKEEAARVAKYYPQPKRLGAKGN